MEGAPYLTGVSVLPERVPPSSSWPFNLPFLDGLDIELHGPITFLVGENGAGKTTFLEAIASLCRFPVSGGGRNELSAENSHPLCSVLRPRFRQRPKDGFFFRADTQVRFSSLLEERAKDPDFDGDPYVLYGGRSLSVRSHGEAFLSVFQHRVCAGLFLLDEPDSALSPQRQLALLRILYQGVESGETQFLVSTHSPILLTFPGAEIISFDHMPLRFVRPDETLQYQITRGLLNHPELYWSHLVAETSESE